MGGAPSPRLRAIVDRLPLRPGMRILEIGCGPGAAAREIARRIGNGYVLGIDRSATAIRQALAASTEHMATGSLEFRQVAAEDFRLGSDEAPFDLVLAARVGALDGRHPEAGGLAMQRSRAALADDGQLWVDGEQRAVAS